MSSFGLSYEEDNRYHHDYAKEEYARHSPGVGYYSYINTSFDPIKEKNTTISKLPRQNEIFNGKARAPAVGEYQVDQTCFRVKPQSTKKFTLSQAPRKLDLLLCKLLFLIL